MLGKKKTKKAEAELGDNTAMRIMTDGKIRDVSYRELLLSTNMTLEALMSVLAKKKLVSPDELLQEIEIIRDRHQGETKNKSSNDIAPGKNTN